MARGDKLWETLTEAQKKEIAGAARVGCTNLHIAEIMGLPDTTFTDCDKLRQFCRQKRALFRQEVLSNQHKHGKNTPVGSIWQGKQHLGQTDKREDTHKVDEATVSLLGLIDGASRGKLPSEE